MGLFSQMAICIVLSWGITDFPLWENQWCPWIIDITMFFVQSKNVGAEKSDAPASLGRQWLSSVDPPKL